jgi:hypothetical protein
MALKWADELSDSAPLPALEPFYILAALELGDPDNGEWLLHHAADFHALYRQYREAGEFPNMLPTDSAAVLIQYMVWYDRDSRRLKEGDA